MAGKRPPRCDSCHHYVSPHLEEEGADHICAPSPGFFYYVPFVCKNRRKCTSDHVGGHKGEALEEKKSRQKIPKPEALDEEEKEDQNFYQDFNIQESDAAKDKALNDRLKRLRANNSKSSVDEVISFFLLLSGSFIWLIF